MNPGCNIAHYNVTAKLGEGGMGEVWRATDTKLGREIAIKLLPEALAQDADRMARFTREAQTLAALNHPHIAAIYGLEECDGVRALVMELVEGPTLADRIAGGPIAMKEALTIAKEIAEALEYAHERGIVHRDLKPANIKLTTDGQVKVLDFGLAKAIAIDAAASDPASSPTLTMRATVAGIILGTAAYMAPEQARGTPADKRADIWSFGVVLLEILTGRQTFAGESISDTLAAVLRADLDWSALPAETPAAIRRLLRRCLERDRKQRLHDIADARLEIEEALSASAELVPVSAAVPSQRLGSSRWWLVPAAVIGILGTLTGVKLIEKPPAAPPLIRMTIPPIEGETIVTHPSAHTIALSPDGRFAVYSQQGKIRSSLYLLALDETDAKPISNSEDAMAPFWSTDSQHVAFGAAGMLRRFNVQTGTTENVAEVGRSLRSGGWNRDGVLVFGTRNSTLFRVAASGGKPEPITALDKTLGEVTHYWPQFLPDGKHFLYWSRNTDASKSGIFAAELPSKPGEVVRNPKFVVATPYAARFAPSPDGGDPGYLFYIRDANLLAQPFHATRLELSGQATVVARDVHVYDLNGLANFSLSNTGRLMYISGSGRPDDRLIWYDRSGKPLGPAADSFKQDFARGTLSSDDRYLAVAYGIPGKGPARSEIVIFELQAGTRLSLPVEGSVRPRIPFSPDGRWLAYATTEGVSRIRTDGSDRQVLLKGSNFFVEDWSPDGKHLAISDASDVLLLPVGEGNKPGEQKAVPLLNNQGRQSGLSFSPDGRFIVYTSDESGEPRAYVEPFPRRGAKWQISTAPVASFVTLWRRDGREIVLQKNDSTLQSVAVDLKNDAPRFGSPQDLFNSYGLSGITRDGKRIVAGERRTFGGGKLTVVFNWQNLLEGK